MSVRNMSFVVCMLLACCLQVCVGVGNAKSYSSPSRSSYSSPSRSYSQPSRSYSPPAASTPSTGSLKYGSPSRQSAPEVASASPAAPARKYGNSAGAAAGAAVVGGAAVGAAASQKPSLQSASQKSADKTYSKEQSAASLASYKQQQSQFKQTAAPVSSSAPSASQSAINRTVVINHDTYYPRYQSFYGGYGWNMPAYGYGYSSYGMWSSPALWFMLGHMSQPAYASMYYNHYDDPGMRAWRHEADRLAVDNAEVRAQLAEADRKRAELSGQPKDPSYLPAEMGDLALAPQDGARVAQAPAPVAPPKPKSHWLLWTFVVLGIGGLGAYFIFRPKKTVIGGSSW